MTGENYNAFATVVLLQGGESRGDRFIECLRGDLNGVLNVSNILYRNCARSENHT